MPHPASSLRSAWEKMGKRQSVSSVRVEIRESWERCLKMGLQPCSPPTPVISPLSPNLTDFRIRVYNKFIDVLYERLQPPLNSDRFVIMIISNDGTLLHLYGHHEILDLTRESGIICGMKTTEETSGTCAPSLTLITKRPSKVIMSEHFFERFHWATCLGFPIYGTRRELVGVIDITSDHLLQNNLEQLYEHISENQLSLQDLLLNPEISFDNLYYKSYFNATFYDNPEPMFLLDRSGLLIDLNKTAEDLLINCQEHLVLDMDIQRFLNELVDGNLSKMGDDAFILDGFIKCCSTITVLPLLHRKNTIAYLVKLQKKNRSSYNVKIKSYNKLKESVTIISRSTKMKNIIDKADVVAETDSAVLIEGQTGTGKEILAKYIHLRSSRSNEPFVAINCAAIPEELFESEMFGYERGAYTGAKKDGNIGKFELANNGTLFLDEIQALNLSCQAKLLRAIEEKEIYRIGSTKAIKLNFRIISASSCNLFSLTRQGKFLEALYFRLRVNYFTLPPLRDRKEDIPLLAVHFLEDIKQKYGNFRKEFDPKCYEFLSKFNWPGNVRQLKNLIEEAYIISQDDKITPEILESCLSGFEDYQSEDHLCPIINTFNISEVTTSVIKRSLSDSRSLTEAAKKLGISRSTLYRKLRLFDQRQNDTSVIK